MIIFSSDLFLTAFPIKRRWRRGGWLIQTRGQFEFSLISSSRECPFFKTGTPNALTVRKEKAPKDFCADAN